MNPIPTKDQIRQWIAENPGLVAKRDIAKAFGIKGDAKIDLKRILREMAPQNALILNNLFLATAMGAVRLGSRMLVFGVGRQVEADLKQTIFDHLLGQEPGLDVVHFAHGVFHGKHGRLLPPGLLKVFLSIAEQ